MSRKTEYEGKDVDDAINKACATLKTTPDELDIEVISAGSSGIFGLCRKAARIIVSKKQNAGRSVFSSKGSTFSGTEKRVEGSSKQKETPAELSAEILDSIKKDLDQILDLMGIDLSVKVTSEGSKARAHISGDSIEEIIGPEGQTLDSLQFLLRKIISRRFEEKILFSLDAGEYRESRAKELEEKALQVAEEVKKTGQTATISAINPAERRIVHMVLQTDSAIRSRSVGEGLFKKVLIYLPGKGRRKPQGRRRNNNRKPQKKQAET